MNSSALITGLLPLVAFAVADMFFGLKTGLIAAVILALAEAIWSFATFGEIDQITLLSFLLIAGMGVLAWKKRSALLFKMQPSIISTFLGGWLVISWINNDPLFLAMAHKYASLMPEVVQQNLHNPWYLAVLERATLTTGIALFLHAAASAIAAWKLSTWWWIAVRGIGFYAFCFIGMLLAQFSLR